MATARGVTRKQLVDRFISAAAFCVFMVFAGFMTTKPWLTWGCLWFSGFWAAVAAFRLNRLFVFDTWGWDEAPPAQ